MVTNHGNERDVEPRQPGPRTADDAVWDRMDLTKDEEWWSPRYYALLGFEPDELEPRFSTWRELVHPDDLSLVERALDRAIEEEGPFDIEYRLKTKRHGFRWFRSQGFVLGDGGPAPTRMTGVLTDVEARRRADDMMQLQAELINQVHDCVIATDMNGRIELWNTAAEQLYGYSEQEMVGSSADRIYADEQGDRYLEYIVGPILEGRRFQGVVHSRRRNGEVVTVDLRLSLQRDHTGRPIRVIGCSNDVGRQRRLDAKVQQAQKLESLAVLAGGVAHDFNNLLVAIIGNTELAMYNLAASSPTRRYMADVIEAARRATELSNQMLAYSGRGRFVVERLDLAELLREMRSLLQVSVSKKASLRYDLNIQDPLIEGDPAQIRQLVMNLVTNASEALGDEAGQIAIRLSVMDASREYLESTFIDEALPQGRYIALEVADTGVGMDQETQERVFDPFFSTKFTGRGLGLAAVLGILRAHRGAIRIYSQKGHGSTFKLLFPSVLAPEVETERMEFPDWKSSGRILVADDERRVQQLVGRVLKKAGFEAVFADDGPQAIEILSDNPGEFRAILLDLTMPRMSAEAVYREMRQLDRTAPIVLMSGFHEQEVSERFAGKGTAGFIQKPFMPAQMIETLRNAIEPSQAATPPGD